MKAILAGIIVFTGLAALPAAAQTRSPMKPAPQAFAVDVYRYISDLEAANAPAASIASVQGLMDRSRAAGLAGDVSPAVQSYVRATSAHDAAGVTGALAKMSPFEQGLAAYVRHDYGQAQKLWLPVAEGGDAEAQANLGMLYAGGNNGAAQDDKEALRWYRQAALQGQEAAQENLALLYADGRDVPRDPMRAFLWRTLAAQDLVMARHASAAAAMVKLRDSAAPDQATVTQALDKAARCTSSQYKDCD